MPKRVYAGQSLQGADLRGQDLTDHIFYGTDFTRARLNNARISLNCATFTGAKLDDETVSLLLLLIRRADITPSWQEGLLALVQDQLGERRTRNLRKIMDLT